jgi:hypothetical protein
MNTGSNPVGVASTSCDVTSGKDKAEGKPQGTTTEHPSSGLIRSGYDPGVSGTPGGVQEDPSGTVGEGVGEGAGQGVPPGDTGKTRKGRKPGLCKRRGCKEPVADILTRLCAQHMPQGMGVAPEAPELSPGFTGCMPIAGQEVDMVVGCPACGKAAAAYDKESGLCYTCETERRERAGLPPLPEGADFEISPTNLHCRKPGCTAWASSPRGLCAEHERQGLQLATGLDDVPFEPIPEEAEQPSDAQPPATVVLCQQFDCMQPPDPKGAGFCGKHAEELGLLPQIRVCAGVPGAVGDEVCHTILGEDVKGERCAHCQGIVDRAQRHLAALRANRAAMQAGANPEPLPYRACDRVGCRAQREPGSRYCASHKRIAATVGEMVLREAFEAAWEALSDSSQLDPATVAACKQLRDAEVGQ